MGGKDNEPQPLTPEGVDYTQQEAPKSGLRRFGSLLVALFLLANIIVLYILHFADRGSSSGDSVSSGFASTTLAADSSASKGQAVSFGADGKLTAGAGTTAYLAAGAASLPSEDKYTAYIYFAPLGTSEAAYPTNIVSYQVGSSPDIESVVTTFSVDAAEKTVSLAAQTDGNTLSGATIKDLSTLSDKLAVALSTVTASDGVSYEVYVTPVSISGDAVTLEQDKTFFSVNNSATNYLTRIADSHFALVYYEPYTTAGYYQRVKVGSVADDGTISYSNNVKFGDINLEAYTTIGSPQAVSSADEKFVIPWFVDNSYAASVNGTTATASGLCLFTANFTSGTVATVDESCNTAVQPAYFVSSTQLGENAVAFIFFDSANGHALTVQVVEYSSVSGAPTFRSKFVIEEAAGAFDFGAAYGFYPTPTVRTLPNDRLSIAFLNPSNTGKPSVKVLSYTSDYTLSDVSPVLPVANADFTVASADPNAYGSIVLDQLPVETGFVVSYSGLWAGAQNQRIALVESLGKPVGIVTESGSDLTVAITGTVDVSADLTSGNAYYAATSGELYAAATTSGDDYILADDSKIVISKDALVGVAVSGSKLVVTV